MVDSGIRRFRLGVASISLIGVFLVILLMGVSGAGKTTIGSLLASELGWEFADGDDYHSPENIEKMKSGIPLTDADRAPWLESLRTLIANWIGSGTNGVLACSALKKSYRDELCVDASVRVVYLKADRRLLRDRLHERHGHYMKEGLLDSQIGTLEEPNDAVVIDAVKQPEEIVREIIALFC